MEHGTTKGASHHISYVTSSNFPGPFLLLSHPSLWNYSGQMNLLGSGIPKVYYLHFYSQTVGLESRVQSIGRVISTSAGSETIPILKLWFITLNTNLVLTCPELSNSANYFEKKKHFTQIEFQIGPQIPIPQSYITSPFSSSSSSSSTKSPFLVACCYYCGNWKLRSNDIMLMFSLSLIIIFKSFLPLAKTSHWHLGFSCIDIIDCASWTLKAWERRFTLSWRRRFRFRKRMGIGYFFTCQ